LCHFVLITSFFSHRLKRGIVVTSMTRSLRPTPRVGACS
jgi:hypothetical protein